MIRTLLIIAGAALVLAAASFGGAFALGGRDMAKNGWSWTFKDDDGESVRFERVRDGETADLGPIITRTLPWTGGQTLEIEHALAVEYVQGDTAGVTVTGPKALGDRVQLENGRLFLGGGEERVVFGWDKNGPTARSERDELRIVVTAPNINAFDLEGSGRLMLRDYDQDTLTIDLSGSGDITATGRTRTLELDIAGSGDADMSGLTTTDANVAIAGSGDARVAPTGRADISISGSGDVDVTTRPATVDQKITGSGDVNFDRVTITTKTTRDIVRAPGVSVTTSTEVPAS